MFAASFSDVRIVQFEYAQDWLTTDLETTGQKQAAWRTDPAQSGIGGCIGDIGTHAFHLADFMTGLEIDELSAELTSFVPGRRLDDNVQIMLRYNNHARGMIWTSQVAPGNENNLKIRIYGSKGGLEWLQEHPNQLIYNPLGEVKQILSCGTGAIGSKAARITRLPGGHPEGYIEAFAIIYSEVGQAIKASRTGKSVPSEVLFPTITDGVKGLAFIETAVRSSKANARGENYSLF